MSNYRVQITLAAKDDASQALKQVNKGLDDMGQKAKKADTGTGGLLDQLGGLQGVVTGVAGAFAAWQIGQKALEMRDLGQTSAQTANTFQALQGGALAAEQTMQRLRTATRGVEDDTSLMAGASLMLQTNVATNNAELENFIDMAVSLKKPTVSAADAIENFTAMMANQSVLRLDSFGISSGRVTERINELLDSGQALNREEGFRMAVLEEGARSMDRLGDSIEQNASQWDQLMVRGQNALSAIGEGIFGLGEIAAGGLNAAIDAVDTLITHLDELEAERQVTISVVQEVTQPAVDEIVNAAATSVPAESMDAYTAMAGLGSEELAGLMESIRYFVEAGNIDSNLSTEDMIRQYEWQTGQLVTGEQRQVLVATLEDYFVQAAETAAQQAAAEAERVAEENGWGPVVGQLSNTGQWMAPQLDPLMAARAGGYQSTMAARAGGTLDLAERQRREAEADEARRQSQYRSVAVSQIINMESAYRSFDLLPEFSALGARRRAYDGAEAGQNTYYQGDQDILGLMAQRLVSAGAAGSLLDVSRGPTGQLFPNASMAAYQGMGDLRGVADIATVGQGQQWTEMQAALDSVSYATDDFALIADMAGQTADAFERAGRVAGSLSELFNEGAATGLEAEVYNRIANQIEDPVMRQQFLLATGASTGAEQSYQQVEDVIAGLGAGDRTYAAQQLAQIVGQEGFVMPTDPNELLNMIGLRNVGGGGGAGYTTQEGDSVWGLARRYGMTEDEVMQQLGIDNPYVFQYGMTMGQPQQWVRAPQTVAGAGTVGGYAVPDSYTGADMMAGEDPWSASLNDNLTLANEQITTVQTAIDGIKDTVANVTLAISADMSGLPPVFMELLAAGSLAAAVASVNQTNGGTSPGTSPTARNRGRTTRGSGGVQQPGFGA